MKLPVAVACLSLTALMAPPVSAAPTAILLTAEHQPDLIILNWTQLGDTVNPESWIVERHIDGFNPENIELPGNASGYAEAAHDAALGYAYRVYYMLDGDRSEPSNAVIIFTWPHCDVIQGPNVKIECLFPPPF